MIASESEMPHHVRLLVRALRDPAICQTLDLVSWDLLVRTARSARLLGVLSARIETTSQNGYERLPACVRHHLFGATIEARHRKQMALYEVDQVLRVLEPLDIPVIALKGAAYIAQDLRCAAGRMPEDVDLMVPRDRLDEAERALLRAGWQFEKLDEYDQHYYRAWSHELPPMRVPGHAFELDLHHTILPPTGRLKPNAGALFAASLPSRSPPLRVLAPADQVLHASAHLFQDSDLTVRLRDLVDVDSLAREFAGRDSDFWRALASRAEIHQLGRPLWYAMNFARDWFGTGVPDSFFADLHRFRPNPVAGRLVARLAARALPPVHPDHRAAIQVRLARGALAFRSVWLRMPPWLLAYHATRKVLRGLAGHEPVSDIQK